jgi:hypothetical protein
MPYDPPVRADELAEGLVAGWNATIAHHCVATTGSRPAVATVPALRTSAGTASE